MSHLEGLDQPVVARLAAAAQRSLHHRVARLVVAHGLVHHVDERQGGIFVLHGVIPFHYSVVAVVHRQRFQPAGILSSPHQGVELISEAMLLGIVEGTVAAPVVAVARTLHRAPFRLVLTSNLVPQLVERVHSSSGIHVVAGGDVAQKLVGVRRQLGTGFCQRQ